mgnify:CR=1 FL=1
MTLEVCKKLIELKFSTLAPLGIDVEAVSSAFLERCADEKSNTQSALYAAFWDAVFVQKNQQRLPMRIAEEVPFGALGVIDYLTATASDIDSFFRLLHSQFCEVIDFISIEIVEESDSVWVSLHSFDHRDPKMVLEFVRCLIIHRLRRAVPDAWQKEGKLHPDWTPQTSHWKDFIPASRTHRGYSVPVIALNKPRMNTRLSSADMYLHELLIEHYLRASETPRSTLNIVLAIRNKLRTGEASPHKVAEELGMSERTMQRRLAEIGQNFRGVVDDFRYEQALKLLQNDSLTLKHVALELGYADLASFGRAYKRWTTQGPGAWRKSRRKKTHLKQVDRPS